MKRNLARIAAVTTLAAAALTAPGAAPAAAATWTRITSPSNNVTYHYKFGVTNHLHVVGQTSADVTQVDIECVTFVVGQPPQVEHVALAVPVSSGSFAVTGSLPNNPPTNCRLRAIPDPVDVETDYLGAYSGPILYTDA